MVARQMQVGCVRFRLDSGRLDEVEPDSGWMVRAADVLPSSLRLSQVTSEDSTIGEVEDSHTE